MTGFFGESPASLGDFARYKIPVFFVNSLNDEECTSVILSLGIDLLLNVGTPRKLSKMFLQNVGCDVLNVHPGVLPKYRGASCVEWEIFTDGPIGNTAHFMVEDYNAGPIIALEDYRFQIGSSYSDIRTKIYTKSTRLMVESVGLILRNGLNSRNIEEQNILIDPYPPMSPEDMLIVLEKIKNSSHHAICLN